MSTLPRRKFLLFTNCFLLLPPEHSDTTTTTDGLSRSDLLVDEVQGKIVKILEANEGADEHVSPNDSIRIIDCRGHIVSPGFIDIQLNGAYGVDFSDPSITREKVDFVAKRLPETGVTSFSPTLISCSPEEYRKILPVIGPMCVRSVNEEKGDVGYGAKCLGLHLEGPFFAPNKAGAHPIQHILDPVDGIDTVYNVYGTTDLCGKYGVKTITLAPERTGALNATQALSEEGIVVSMGHTEATLEDGRSAVQHGATLITHLFNAMKSFHHREPALLGLLAESGQTDKKPRLYFSIIADGIHVHPTAVHLAQSLHPAGVVLITDAMSATGLGDGTHTLGDTSVVVRGMKATVAGTGTLAGSVASMEYCIRSYRQFTKCSVAEVLRAATLNPARVIGCDDIKGRLASGCDADLVLLDDDLNVMGTWIQAREEYKAFLAE